MKYIATICALFFVMGVSSCQEKNKDKKGNKHKAPKEVVIAFQLKYPNEKVPDFKTDSHGYWEAHFKQDGEKYRADFHEDGTWRETENTIKMKNLPQPILDQINTTYALHTVGEVEHVMSATYGEFYDVEFKHKGKNRDIMFKKDGTIIQEKK